MKIIDLLNKIANGEEVPKKIKVDNNTYHFDFDDCDYYNDNELKSSLLENIFCHNAYVWFNLNAEILEEEKKIPEEITMCTSGIMGFDAVEHITTELKDKINSIIDYLKSKGE